MGTSAGGITALGLACGFTARELIQRFPAIMGETFSNKCKLGVKHSKYDGDNMKNILETDKGFGKENANTKIGDLKKVKNVRGKYVRVVVTTAEEVQTNDFDPVIVDSQDPRYKDFLVIDAARCTSAAPFYFQGAGPNGNLYDGGVFANNPAAWAMVLACQNHYPEQIKLLSVGTGEVAKNKPKETHNPLTEIWH